MHTYILKCYSNINSDTTNSDTNSDGIQKYYAKHKITTGKTQEFKK